MLNDVMTCFSFEGLDAAAVPLFLLDVDRFADFLQTQSPAHQAWLKLNGFTGEAEQHCLLPDAAGHLAMVCVGLAKNDDATLFAVANLSLILPNGVYYLANAADFDDPSLYLLSLGWGLGSYQFTRYKTSSRSVAQWILPKSIDQKRLTDELSACFWVRDLINTPAEDMMPEHLAEHAENLAKRYRGQCHQLIGDELLTSHYPMIHAVGRASSHAPRLIDLRFGAAGLPKLTLVGKGVCFDSGGLDVKPASGMLLMKKDMGGAAHVLGLAQLILAQGLPVQLRVLIPAVDNAISGNAFRPGDILPSRHGQTVEIGNTDAEGRLILADALTAAVEEAPDYLIDFATLTGAARVAVGTEIAAYFSNDEALAAAIQTAAQRVQDPCWRLPLFKPYQRQLKSPVADLNNAPGGGYAGAITAALFLQAFVPDALRWVHFDVMAFNIKSSTGKPEGGEAMGLRAIFQVIEQTIGH